MSDALIERCAALHPAVVSDVLDQLGYRQQVMAPRIRPLYPDARVAGRARTVRVEPVDGPPERAEDNYAMQLEAIESLAPDHVMVVSQIPVCFWGELLSLAAQGRGAQGIVIDGYTRDIDGIVALAFPTFVAGIHAADALGRAEVVEYGGRITSGDVAVDDGDLVLGASDGVVVVPVAVAEKVVGLAEEKVQGEDAVKLKLGEGMSVSEAYSRYGVL
jgi:4-hydroxy-4-methyl-2-oxoglutarate aldolase